MDMGKKLRMRRIFKNGGNAIIVPMDHGLYYEPSGNLRDLHKLVKVISKTEADAILITPGMLGHVEDVIGDLAIVFRLDGTHTRMGQHLEKTKLISNLEQAVASGADIVVVNIFIGVDNEDEHLEKLGTVATACFRYGMPLMAEMVPASTLLHQFGKAKEKGKDAARDMQLAGRLAAELGADCIKCQYTGDVESFKEVGASTPLPIVIAGGPKADTDEQFLDMIKDCIKAGARGICIGRNVWGRDNPAEILSKLHKIVHK